MENECACRACAWFALATFADDAGRGVSVRCGYQHMRTDHAYDRATLRDVIADALTDPDADTVEITLIGCSDHGGSILDRANIRELGELFDIVAVTEDGRMGECSASVVVDPDTDPAILRDIMATLSSLVEYPLISDESVSTLEMELCDDAWDAFLSWDVMRDMDAYAPDDDTIADEAPFVVMVPTDISRDEVIRGVFYEHMSDMDAWHNDGPNSMVPDSERCESTVRVMVRDLFGWQAA